MKISHVLFFLLLSCGLYAQTAPTFVDRYSKKSGNLRMSATRYDLGRVYNNQVLNDTIFLYNSGKTPMEIQIVSPTTDFMKLNVSRSPIPPDGEGYITLVYDAAKKNDYGFVMDMVQLHTSDSILNEKFIYVAATLQQYFPPPEPGDTLRAKARTPEGYLSFGKLGQGDRFQHDFMIYNDGAKPLVFHKLKTTCPCVKASVSKYEIAPGGSASLHAEIDPTGKEGKVSMVVYLFTNDPLKPELKFEMLGEIVK